MDLSPRHVPFGEYLSNRNVNALASMMDVQPNVDRKWRFLESTIQLGFPRAGMLLRFSYAR